MYARFNRIEWENPSRTIASVYLEPEDHYPYTAGQYADITVPHADPDSRGQTRTMTFSTSPDEPTLGFITHFDEPRSSYKQAVLALRPGDRVSLTSAMGDMVLPLDASRPLIFVAGGVGIASYVGMVKWLTAHSDRRDISLLYSVRDCSDIICSHVFGAYAAIGNLTQTLFTADPDTGSYYWPGDISGTRISSTDIHARMTPDCQVYISGSEQMVEQLRTELFTRYQVPQYQVAFDYFDGYVGDI